MNRKTLFSIYLGLLLLSSSPVEASDEARAFLLKGVKSVAKPGIPGPIVIVSKNAFPVIAGVEHDQPYAVVAAGFHGKGRFVAFGHGGYLGSMKVADTGTLLKNSLAWVSQQKKAPKVAFAFIRGPLQAFFKAEGAATQALGRRPWKTTLEGVDVLCIDPNNSLNKGQISAVHAFIKRGGGVISSQLGWGWKQLNPSKSLVLDHPGNRLFRDLGIVWGDGYLGKIMPKKADFKIIDCHALEALNILSKRPAKLSQKRLSRLCRSIAHATRSLPSDHEFLKAARGLVTSRPASWPPSAKHPLGTKAALARLALTLEHQHAAQAKPSEVKPFASHAEFPGAPRSGAKPVTRTLEIRRDRGGWISTGLFAPAGEVIHIQSKGKLKKCFVRIGSHSDHLWGKKSWRRHPQISMRRSLTKDTRLASPHGGLIYIEAPRNTALEALTVTIKGGVESPYFVLGKTTLEDWKTARTLPGPWAEFETAKIILTVPSHEIRSLKDPIALMKLWDRVLDCYRELGTRPLPARPERIVTDRQISAGYMHSGYPIMTHLDAADRMVDFTKILGKPKVVVWGLWHELGHNHQKREWTFSGTGEVTCNLFTMYVLDRISGVSPKNHPRAPDMKRKSKAHRAEGAPFEKWKRDPFLALAMYIEIQQDFGWELFKKVFAQYRDLPNKDRPRSDAQRRDQWLQRLSHTAKRDFGPFFQQWGVPVSKAALDSVKHYKKWLPANFAEK